MHVRVQRAARFAETILRAWGNVKEDGERVILENEPDYVEL